ALADGTLTHLSGQVSVTKADGATVPASVGLEVLSGETVITGDNGYARLEMSDGGEMLIRQDSQLKIENYRFDKDKPDQDSALFRVIKGGFRTLTGLISKRGNKDAYQVRTSTATIGIRGTQYDLRLCQANCGTLPDGTYVAVRYGEVAVDNPQGSQNFTAGQVGFASNNQPPVQLPRDPGVGFKSPPDFPKLEEKKKSESGEKTSSNTAGKDDDAANCSVQ
ncbi:MAG TPA: FecR domain-containing protein, partial [Methyloradius sp.]